MSQASVSMLERLESRHKRQMHKSHSRSFILQMKHDWKFSCIDITVLLWPIKS
jgi:hypothetical protein